MNSEEIFQKPDLESSTCTTLSTSTVKTLPIKIFCLSYKNEERRKEMLERFQKVGLVQDQDYFLTPGVEDPEYSLMKGHLDMISRFVSETKDEYAIFCEDDVMIHKDLKQILPLVLQDFKNLQLDVLLLGYLTNANFRNSLGSESFSPLHPDSKPLTTSTSFPRFYFTYPENQWGTQMYMLSRTQGLFLLSKYSEENLKKAREGKPIENWKEFAADFSITKENKRALLFPMVGIEKSIKHLNHLVQGHVDIHVHTFYDNITDDYY